MAYQVYRCTITFINVLLSFYFLIFSAFFVWLKVIHYFMVLLTLNSREIVLLLM